MSTDLRNVIRGQNVGNFGTGPRWRGVPLGPAAIGRHRLASLVACGAAGGNVGTGADIVVLRQTASTQMKLVDFALHHRSLRTAQIATAAHPLAWGGERVPGGDSRLHRPGFGVDTSGDDESA
jgi:hypothetical protein